MKGVPSETPAKQCLTASSSFAGWWEMRELLIKKSGVLVTHLEPLVLHLVACQPCYKLVAAADR